MNRLSPERGGVLSWSARPTADQGGADGRGAADPGRADARGAAAARAARAEPAGRVAHAGDRQRPGRHEPGGSGAAHRHGAPSLARRRGPLQRGGARGAARPAQARPTRAAERGGAGGPGRARLRRTRPGAGRRRRLDAGRPGPLARGPLRQGVPPVQPLAGAQAPRPVAAEDPSRPSRGRPGGPGALRKKGLRDALRAAAEARPGKRIALWFMDEARVGQKGRLCHRWWLRGRRPPGRCDRRFEWAYIFAAVEPATGANVALILPEATTATMSLFLAEFAAELPEDVHAVLVLDGAGWHGARALAVPPNITLLPLPPYSPELNPVERIWLYLRERFLSLCNHPWVRNVSS